MKTVQHVAADVAKALLIKQKRRTPKGTVPSDNALNFLGGVIDPVTGKRVQMMETQPLGEVDVLAITTTKNGLPAYRVTWRASGKNLFILASSALALGLLAEVDDDEGGYVWISQEIGVDGEKQAVVLPEPQEA